jgi:hypothetical protein
LGGGMSDYTSCNWPTLAELKQVLDVDPQSSDWETTLGRVLTSAIQQVKDDTGEWDDLIDVPTCKQAQAALRMAELLSLRPETAAAASADPTYQRLMFGSHRRFAIS